MAVGVLLLTHSGLGQALIAAAHEVVGPFPLQVTAIDFGARSDTAKVLPRAAYALRELDRGDGVLVLTDLYGSTPSNLAAQLGHEGVSMRRVSGLNLPMLLRVLNYAEQTLDELVLTAAAGARTGVVVDTA